MAGAFQRRSAGLWLATWCVATAAVANEPAPTSEAMLADAQLADVAFVDRAHGWAVGDRGVIWHTSDGGRHWTLQSSGVDCRLSSVFFLSDKVGWAAGGYTQPYTRATVGVVLSTRDGGGHWTPLRTRILPTIKRIGFFDLKQGWAVGQSSAYFPTGVYVTSDGGQSWSAVPGTAGHAWLAGDFVDPNTGALAGCDGALATVRRRGVEPQPSDFGLRALRRMKLVAPAGGWLVGDGGLVLATRDLGKSWQTAEGPLPPGCARHFDFAAVAVRGEHCWVAGTPGTRVLHSGDGGRTWQAADTGQPLPIRALAFADDETGWAVGDMGLILGTTDGGRTWKRQRAGAARSAFAGFFSRPAEIPLELVARLAADDGYIGAIEILNRESSQIRSPLDADALAHEASVRAGASVGGAAWRFPLRWASLKLSADQLVEDWNRANDGEALEKLEAHIVGRIRMWRPNVVVTVGAEARDPLALAINQIVLGAVEHAADPTRHAEQIAEAGLRPWKVQKVYAALRDGTGTANINTAQVTARLGRSIGELAAPARGLVAKEYAPPPPNVAFRLLVDHIPQEVGQRDFFSGISLAPGGEARRAYEETSRNNFEAARREAQRFRNLQAILAQADSDQRDGHFLANIADQTRDMEPGRAAEVLFQLAERYWIRGRWDLAAECYEVIAERHATHPLAGASLVWLVQYYASGEATWRSRGAGQIAAGQATPIAKVHSGPSQGSANERAGQAGGVRQAAAVSGAAGVVQKGGVVASEKPTSQHAARASLFAEQLEQVEPALAVEPRVRFPLAVALRRQGLSGDAERFYQALTRNRPPDAWRAIAETELWLIHPKDRPPKEIWNCPRADGKPRLDGRLEEPLWHAANVVELRSPERDDGQWGAVAMLAYDEEFLYIGVSCARALGFRYDTSNKPRPRDPDLSDHDRVELLLDVDRDFATYYRLVIDHRGWTGESCWHDATWDPAWFVASGGDDQAWTAEAAIPLSELTGQVPQAGTSWAVGVERIVPGVGFQSWTTPAAPEVLPEGFGYLMFRP
ncbi:MAG: YCF48-related protein [Pirellulales bacterium]